MPWKVAHVSELRFALAHAVRTAGVPVAEAARSFGVGRKTAYKWLARHDAGPDAPLALADRSRRPRSSPRRTPPEVEARVLAARDRFGWGPVKIHAVMLAEGLDPPPARTIAAILARGGGRVRAAAPPGSGAPPQRFERSEPNELWQLDFKGPVEVGRERVSTLSVLDDHSRYAVCLKACRDMTFATVQAALWDVFAGTGLPGAILCDNAFSARNSGIGLSSFDAWLIRLGIAPIHGRAYHPQTQGKVERFHRTLEDELWPTIRRGLFAEFDADLAAWRPVYNAKRPHEALENLPPVTRWRPDAARPRPDRVPEMTYPEGSTVRRVGGVGEVRWKGARIMAGRGLAGEPVRIVEAAGELEIRYGDHKIRSLRLSDLPRDRML